MADRVPQSLEAEQNLIACILVDPDCLPIVRELVQPSDFFNENCRLVYSVCLSVPVCNQATVFWELDRDGHLDTLGRDYLSNLIARMVSLEPETYAGIVRQAAYSRRVTNFANEAARLGYSGNATPEKMRELIRPFLDGPPAQNNTQYRGIRRAT